MLVKSKLGRQLVSIILGFGLASLFRKVCKGTNCYVIRGPKISEVAGKLYRLDDRCYTYKPLSSLCEQV